MAGPRVFVPGPSVGGNLFGSPVQFTNQIADTVAGFQRRRIMDERTQNDKLFKEQTASLNKRKQDFVEAAPGRAEDLRVANLARSNEQFEYARNIAEGAQYAGGDRFTNIEDQFAGDANYAALDDKGKLAARNKFILDNPSSITPPKEFAKIMSAGLSQSGKFTAAEINSYVSAEVSKRYPSADKELVKAQLLKPSDLLPKGSSSNNTYIGADGRIFSTGGRSGSKLINKPSSQADRTRVVDQVQSDFALDDKTATWPWWLGGGRMELPGGELNASRQDISQVIGLLATEGGVVTPTAAENVFAQIMTPDGEFKEGYDYRTAEGRAKIIKAAQTAQATEERLLTKGGDISAAGQAARGQIFSPVDAANQAAVYNEKLLSTLTPQALSDEGLAKAFLDSLGPQTQPGKVAIGDGGVATPGAVAPLFPQNGADQGTDDNAQPIIDGPRPGARGNIDLGIEDFGDDITGGDTLPAPGGPQQDQIFNVGGQVPAERAVQNIFGAIQENAQASNPVSILANAAQDAVPAAKKLFESLTPPDAGILGDGGSNLPAPEITSSDLNSIPSGQRQALQKKAKAAWKAGDISLDDAPSGGTLQDKILIAYLKSIEGNRN